MTTKPFIKGAPVLLVDETTLNGPEARMQFRAHLAGKVGRITHMYTAENGEKRAHVFWHMPGESRPWATNVPLAALQRVWPTFTPGDTIIGPCGFACWVVEDLGATLTIEHYNGDTSRIAKRLIPDIDRIPPA